MGSSDYSLKFLDSLTPSDWIAIIGLIINAILTYWIVRTIQNKLTNQRVLKDHFINELKNIRVEYKDFVDELLSGKTHPKKVIPWFKLMNIRINDLIGFINQKYKIESKILNPYQNELRDLITENEDFILQYKNNEIILSEKSKNEIIKFQQENNNLFNKIIVYINDK